MKPRFLLDEHLRRAIQEQLCEMHVRLITYIKELRKVWNSSTPEQYQDVIQYLP